MNHGTPRPGLFVLYPAGRATDGLLKFKVTQQIIIDSNVSPYILIRPKAIIKLQRLKVLNFRIRYFSHSHTDPDWSLPPLGTWAHYTDLQSSFCSSSSFRQCVLQGLRMTQWGFTEKDLLLEGQLSAVRRPGCCVCFSWHRKSSSGFDDSTCLYTNTLYLQPYSSSPHLGHILHSSNSQCS